MKHRLGLISFVIAAIAAAGLALAAAPPTAGTPAVSTASSAAPITAAAAAVAPTTADSTSVAVSAASTIRPNEVINSLAPSASVSTTATTAATAKPAAPASVAAGTVDSHQAYLDAMYVAVVPASQRAALAGRYVIGYNIPGMSCGTGCTGRSGTQVRSSFSSAFFAVTTTYQRNLIAHEAAHAYGFLFLTSYSTPDWTNAGGWQAAFHSLDRGFVGTYDAEAWAACVAWKETGFNNKVDQVSHVCTEAAAELAIAHIA